MKLSEMKQILSAGEIQLTKSLGQNFLHDANQLRRIIAAAELTKTDKVLEIGPGLGPLTELLLENADEVLAIEKDKRLVEVLKSRFPTSTDGKPALCLIHDDALAYLRREARDWHDWKLVANLPYSVASPILVELALGDRPPERLVATLQLEVARRLMASAGEEDYGLLTLLVQQEYQPRGWFKIPAGCFFPEPEVASACVALVRRAQPLLAAQERETFTRLVKTSFSQRRKMMLKLLKQEWAPEQLRPAFETMQIPLGARAETLTLAQFAGLTHLLHQPKRT